MCSGGDDDDGLYAHEDFCSMLGVEANDLLDSRPEHDAVAAALEHVAVTVRTGALAGVKVEWTEGKPPEVSLALRKTLDFIPLNIVLTEPGS